MKKSILLTVCLVVTGVLLSLVFFASAPQSVEYVEQTSEKTDVVTVVDNEEDEIDYSRVVESRFLNMLNRNYVYNDSYYTVEDVVNDSVIALLDMRDSEDDSYISEDIVSDFVYDMYGIEVDFSQVNTKFPKKDGYVFILPRGYELYKHTVTNITENEDGTYSVKTNVEITTHDRMTYNEVCETLFVPNENSKFGFNIVHSNIVSVASAI